LILLIDELHAQHGKNITICECVYVLVGYMILKISHGEAGAV
jgi:hypothetical protein